MNYDPKKYCLYGQHMRPRSEFRPLPGVFPKREVCEACYQKIMTARERVRALAVGRSGNACG